MLALSVADNCPAGGMVPWSTAMDLIRLAFDTMLALVSRFILPALAGAIWQPDMAQLLETTDFTFKNLGPGVLPPGSGSVSSVLEHEKVMPIVAITSMRYVSFFIVVEFNRFLKQVS